MTELVVVLFLSASGMAAAAYLLRWLLALPTGDSEMNRVANLLREAAESFSRRQSGTLAALGALFGGALFLGYGLRTTRADPVSGLELGVWLLVSFGIGATSTVILGQIATFLGTRGAIRTASAARRSVDAALRAAMRSGTIAGLLTHALVTLTVGLLFLSVLAYHGAFGPEPARAFVIVPIIPILLVGHGLGAAFVAFLGQLSGGTFAKGADIGADLGARDAGLDDDDRENPAAVANLAGDCAGSLASSAMVSFAGASLEDSAAMLGLALVYAHDAELKSPLAVLLLPLLSRAFGLLGTVFGSLVVRTDDREDPLSSLVRGLLVAALLQAVGLAGAIRWLLPTRGTPVLGGAALGVAAAAFIVPWLHYVTLSRFRSVRDVAEASRGGPTLGLLAGFGSGLSNTLWPVLAVAAGTVGAHVVGARWGGPAGEVLAVAGFLIGLVGTSSFLGSLEASSIVIDAASGLVAMTVGRDRREVRGRLTALDAPGTSQRAAARGLAACAALPAMFLFLKVIAAEWARRSGGAETASASSVLPAQGILGLIGGTLGASLVVWLLARSLSGVLRSSRRVLDEVRRQLRDRPPFDAERQKDPPPVDYAPCSEMAARFALRQMVTSGLLAMVVPVALIVGLRILESKDKGQGPGGSVASLIVAATVAGVLGALFAAGAGGAWGNAKKYIVTGAHGGRLLVDETGARAENPTFVASVIGDTLGDPLKDVAVPVVLMIVKLLPVLVLVLLPLIL